MTVDSSQKWPPSVLLTSIALSLMLVVGISGCGSDKKDDEQQEEQAAKPDVSDVPLRIQIVAGVTEPDRITRHWLAFSSQPVDIQSVSVPEFLSADDCDSDVVLYPARLLGELVKRSWITPYIENQTSEEGDGRFVSAATLGQASFGKTKYGVPLGCSVAAVVGSSNLVDQFQDEVAWSDLIEAADAGDSAADIEEVHEVALVDRFLAIVGTLSDRNAKYGLLFELQDMNSRLREDEFIEACSILKSIAGQPAGAILVAGSHDQAWTEVCQSEGNVFTVGLPTLLNENASALQGALPIAIKRSGSLAGWNTGAGLVASISVRCRQSSRANQFVRWLAESSTLDALAPVITGVDSDSPISGPEAASWQVRQSLRTAYSQAGLPREPSLPSSMMYRTELANALISFLKGEATAEDAMASCHKKWAEISGKKRSTLRDAYEKSLGLGI